MPPDKVPRILVVGDVMLDRYVMGSVDRVSPEAPVPVVLMEKLDIRPGGAANVAAGIAELSVSTTLLSVIGTDAAGSDLETIMSAHGVNFQAIRVPSLRTTEKTRIISGSQQIVRVDFESPISEEVALQIVAEFNRLLPDYSAVVFSDYNKGVLRLLPAMLEAAKRCHIPTYVDPKVTEPNHYRGAFLVKPNEKEFKAMLGVSDNKDTLAFDAMNRFDWQHLVVTLGADGMVHFSRDGQQRHYNSKSREVFDVSGAGDTVLATLVASHALGATLGGAIEIANSAAGLAVSRTGTHVVTRAELEAHLAAAQIDTEKICVLDQLLNRLAHTKYSNKKIVFTNGCFDILHAGHVRYLNQARQLGDLLIVGLNEDVSVRSLKGTSRPINPYADRAEVLAGLGCVDFVVGFNEETPLELIKSIRPKVLVKGGDYVVETIVGADIVKFFGGEVVTIPLVEGRSTTSILSRAVEAC